MLLRLHPEDPKRHQVPKTRVAAELALRGRDAEPVAVFVCDRAAHHQGCERPSDLLLAPESFVPVETEGAEVRLVQKGHIAWMRVSVDAEAHGRLSSESSPPRDRRRRVAVTLDDGRVLRGDVVVSKAEAAGRVQDYLNASQSFFELRDDTHITLVNRDHVILVDELG